MANYNKIIDGVLVPLTDAEQTAREKEEKEWADAAPTRLMTELRRQRDILLAETDWMSLPDAPTMSDEWKTYRQALRDITSQTPKENDLSDINWPKKPS